MAHKGNEKKPCEFHLCLRHPMILSRWFGFFPIMGVNEKHHGLVRFNTKSIFTVYSIVTIVLQTALCLTSLCWFAKSDMTLGTFANFEFYTAELITAMLMFKLAIYWPKLMKMAYDTECELNKIRKSRKTSLKATVITYVFIVLALVEHLFSKIFNVKLVMMCIHATSFNRTVIENYYLKRMPYFFDNSFSIWAVVFTEIASVQSTFLWSITDIIIMCISIYLTSYFEDLNEIINSQYKGIYTWSQLRRYYSRLVMLLKQIDSHLQCFTLLSCFTNLFYICLQLYNSLQRHYFGYQFCDEKDQRAYATVEPVQLMYYVFSFLFLATRAGMVSMLAANVHTAAARPIVMLADVPTSEYDEEVIRFQQQLRYNKVGLNGVFFYVTKNTILKVFGAIVTYELVLLQFSKNHDIHEKQRHSNNTLIP